MTQSLTKLRIKSKEIVITFLNETKWVQEILADHSIGELDLSDEIKKNENYKEFKPLFCKLSLNILHWVGQLGTFSGQCKLEIMMCGSVIFLCALSIIAAVLFPCLGWIASVALSANLAILASVSCVVVFVGGVKLKNVIILLEEAQAVLNELDSAQKYQEKPVAHDVVRAITKSSTS